MIAYSYEDWANPPHGVAIMEFEGGPPTKRFDIPQAGFGGTLTVAPSCTPRTRAVSITSGASRLREGHRSRSPISPAN